MGCPLATSGSGRCLRPAPPRRRARPLACFLFVALAVACLTDPSSLIHAQGDLPPEVETGIKAHFVYTAAKFVEWPQWAFAGSEAPIIFGVLGSERFLEALSQQTAGKKLLGRPVIVKGFDRIEEIGPCHVLYVASLDRDRLGQLFGRLKKWSVLTVGEMDLFSEAGGALNLHLQEGMVRFDINLEAARRSGLLISSKLAVLGHVVRDGRQRPPAQRVRSSGR